MSKLEVITFHAFAAAFACMRMHTQELHLTDCRLEELPHWIPQLPALTVLYTFRCDMNERQAVWACGFPALVHCNITSPQLTQACLQQAHSLHSWIAVACRSCASCCCCIPQTILSLMQIHGSLCCMTELSVLDLSRCSIQSVSPAISQLVCLKRLDLSYNNLYPEVRRAGSLHACYAIDSRMPHHAACCTQVPQELSSLTTLTKLNLCSNVAPEETARVGQPNEDGEIQLPKMRLTETSLRFLLHFPYLRIVYLSITWEERDALAGFRTDMRRVHKGRNVLFFKKLPETGLVYT